MKPSLSAGSILAALRKSFGPVEALTPVAQGEESQAFGFRLDGDEFIVRVRPDESGFRKDEFAYLHFCSERLPIPKIVLITPIESNFLCVSQRAPGVTLQDLAVEALPEIARPAGDMMEAVADADISAVSGFGPFDAQGRAAGESWHEFLTSVADPAQYDWTGIGLREALPFVERVYELASQCPEARRLVHGDFGSNNVIVRGSQVTGVIDWSEAMAGDALYDWANIFFWRTWLPCMEWQARYLEPRLRELEKGQERMICYQLWIGLAEAYGNAVRGEVGKALWALRRCREIA